VISQAASQRVACALEWLASLSTTQPALVIGASVDAVSELLHRFTLTRARSVLGWRRTTLAGLARLLAATELTARGWSPLSAFGSEAVCARVAHALGTEGSLGRFQAIASQPGLARALARTLRELRLAASQPGGDLGRIADAYQAELERAQLVDEVDLLRVSLTAESPLLSQPVLLLDLSLHSALEVQLLARFTGPLLATLPVGDERGARLLQDGLQLRHDRLEVSDDTAVGRVQRHLFTETIVRPVPPSDAVEIISAPGEGRECVEVVRRVLREVDRGVPFDHIAILLRSPTQYRGLVGEALHRAGVPAYFARGTLQPDPAGRAFLALLSCAAEGLSARKFAEYLSLGEVPQATGAGEPPAAALRGDRWTAPDEDSSETAPSSETPAQEPAADIDAPVVAGSLRAPWRWEKLIIDAAVIGGRDRWERRLSGLESELLVQLGELEDEPRKERLCGDLADLAVLRAFALPILEALEALPRSALWGDWLDRLSALATQVLRHPERVLSLLSELAPMAPVGPATLDEVRQVLGRRLTELSVPPPARRYGRVFVAPVEVARGMDFEVVFVPGLAEKMFPQKVLQDPLLRDADRSASPGLEREDDRIANERLSLRIAVGAARRKLVLSYPRIELQPARPRVPSFYGLEILRAAEGQLPSFAELARRAEVSAAARIGWPAPANAADAIDEAEHDLALLADTFRQPREAARGTASYLLEANPHLKRALRARARRWRPRWTGADGLVEPSPEALAALAAHLPSARSYSPTGLQHYAECPYKFVLQAIHRLKPREEPQPVEELEPLVRGALMHEVQYELMQELQRSNALPLAPDRLDEARGLLDRIMETVAGRYRDKLAPAIPRVWEDGVLSVSTDLREWVRRQVGAAGWAPWRFELSFGLPDLLHRDPNSTEAPVALDEGLHVRGSIDLVERDPAGALRATDYKSGKVWAEEGAVIGGGALLQPSLYALVLAKLFPGATVQGGRLYYCTFTGEFTEVAIPLDRVTRESVATLARTVQDAVAKGFLPAAPREKECQRCDYLAVCGPHEEFRVKHKQPDKLAPLVHLRGMP